MKKQLFEETKRLRAVHIINKDICEELDNLVREDNSAKIHLNKREQHCFPKMQENVIFVEK